jgi:hypothetical protein
MLARIAKSRIRSVLGVSEPYSSYIQSGKRIPHPRHWQALARLAGSILAQIAGVIAQGSVIRSARSLLAKNPHCTQNPGLWVKTCNRLLATTDPITEESGPATLRGVQYMYGIRAFSRYRIKDCKLGPVWGCRRLDTVAAIP